MSIVDNIRKTFQDTKQHKIFTSKEIKQRVHTKFGVKEDNVCPADRCYNLWNKDLEKKEWLNIFEYHEDKDEYEFLGEGYKYTGKVLHNVRDGKKVYVGEWSNGVFKKYDSPIEIEGAKMFNKEILRKYVAEYKENFMDIRFGKGHEEIYKWKAVAQFQKYWNIDAMDFSDMLTIAWDKTENLLKAGMFYPKNMMVSYAAKEPNMVREMFRNLYDEEINLIERIKNFITQAKVLNKRYSR